MEILYTADLHFGHRDVIGFDQRPFTDVEQMDHFLIQMWNHRVQPDDTVYILGDLCYRNIHSEEHYLRQLTGHKHLIIGNHDSKLLKNENAMSYLESVHELLFINDEGRQVVLCHYPMTEWNGMYQGSYHVFGHIHAVQNDTQKLMQEKERAYNAGCMINGYAPASLNEMIRIQKSMKKENDRNDSFKR